MKGAEDVFGGQNAENGRWMMKEVVAERNLIRRREVDGDANWQSVGGLTDRQLGPFAVAQKPTIENQLGVAFSNHGRFQRVIGRA